MNQVFSSPVYAAQAPWPAGVRACMSQRQGGVSAPPFHHLNLGDHVGDVPHAVEANRQLWRKHTAPKPVFLKQVHGNGVAHLRNQEQQGDEPLQADACWTEEPGVVCTIMVADCLPILFAAADGSSVAAVHAGWRGLAGQAPFGVSQALDHTLELKGRSNGILESLCAQWPAASCPQARSDMVVWLGPCIGPTAFEVGSEVREAFMTAASSEQDAQAIDACFEPLAVSGSGTPKYLANLSALARWRLQRLGFQRLYGNDGSADWCTVSNPLRFFSHRRDAIRLGSTGRMAAGIWRA